MHGTIIIGRTYTGRACGDNIMRRRKTNIHVVNRAILFYDSRKLNSKTGRYLREKLSRGEYH